jgi:hypothetical protein
MNEDSTPLLEVHLDGVPPFVAKAGTIIRGNGITIDLMLPPEKISYRTWKRRMDKLRASMHQAPIS